MTKRYERNPYSYGVVNVMCSFARDYADAKATLDKDPDDVRAKIVVDYCMDFCAWLHEATGFGRERMGRMILRMVEGADDEE